MDISSIINGFNSYLEDLNSISSKTYNISSSSASIFMYANEFKNYLSDELNADASIFSMSINDILEMEVVNGKLVEADDDETDTASDKFTSSTTTEETESLTEGTEIAADGTETLTEETEIAADGTESLTEGTEIAGDGTETVAAEAETAEEEFSLADIINAFLEQDEVKDIIDTDYDGELSEEEIENFLNVIKDYDGDAENISLEDIMSALEAIQNDTFTFGNEEETIVEEDTETTEAASSTTSTSSSSGSSGSSGISGTSSTSSAPVEKTLDNMTKEELDAELSTAETDLRDKQAALSAILDGSNSELQALQDNIDKAYDLYLEQLENVDEDLAEQVDDLTDQINDKEDEIDAKDQEISDQECVVSDAETAYDNAVSTRETLESSLSALQSLDTSDYDDEKKAELSSKISELKTKISEAEEAEDAAKEAWDDAKEKLETLESEKETLQGELDDLNEQMDALEAEILEKYPEIEEYLNAYNDAKEEYTTTKETLTTQAKADVAEAQDYVNEVQTAINNYDNKQTTKEYCFGTFGEDIVEYAQQFLGYNEADGSANIFLGGSSSSATPWCAAFVEYVLENSGQDLPDWYTNISNKWYCPNILNAASAADAIIDSDEVQVGDLVLFDWDGDGVEDHVGIVASVNSDGTITTVEGNSSNQVKSNSYSLTDSRLTYAAIVS